MITRSAARKADDGDGRLMVSIDDDGDMHVAVLREDIYKTTEFCTLLGGGRSPNVRKALVALLAAIEQYNLNDPIGATY